MENNLNNYDLNKCFCKKNKFLNEQCSYKRKENSFFCGIHGKSKVKDIYNIFIQLGLYQEEENLNLTTNLTTNLNLNLNLNEDINSGINLNKSQFIDLDFSSSIDINIHDIIEQNDINNKSKKKVYEDKDVFFEDLFIKNEELSVYTLRQSIKNLNLKIVISTKQSRPELIKELKDIYEKEKNLKKNINYVIKIQNFIKKWLKERLNNCVNSTDILTFDSINDISKELLYIYRDPKTNLKYAYDIRTLIEILNQDKPTCPYTCKEYSFEEKINFMKEIDKRKKSGIKMDIDKIKLKPEEETEMRMIDVFHKLNLLGNYTSHLWFKHLNINQLIKFYTDAEDLWVYRLGLTQKERRKYIKNGQAFVIPLNEVKNYKNLNLLRNVCLDEINRFISDGIGSEEKKLGAMWMLTILVDCSYEAADALPHLVQI